MHALESLYDWHAGLGQRSPESKLQPSRVSDRTPAVCPQAGRKVFTL
jgi:hypothetical protein